MIALVLRRPGASVSAPCPAPSRLVRPRFDDVPAPARDDDTRESARKSGNSTIEEPRESSNAPKRNLSSERAGRAVGVNGRAVSVAKRLVQEAPDLAGQVRSGEKKLWSADAEMQGSRRSPKTFMLSS